MIQKTLVAVIILQLTVPIQAETNRTSYAKRRAIIAAQVRRDKAVKATTAPKPAAVNSSSANRTPHPTSKSDELKAQVITGLVLFGALLIAASSPVEISETNPLQAKIDQEKYIWRQNLLYEAEGWARSGNYKEAQRLYEQAR